MKCFSYHMSFNLTFFRFGQAGRGIAIKREKICFSTSEIYKIYLKIPFGWRIVFFKSIPTLTISEWAAKYRKK